MPDCDYCGESFDDEASYVDHLADSHEGELGAVDRRRVEQFADGTAEEGYSLATYGGVAVALLLVVGLGFVGANALFGSGGGSGETGPLGLPQSGSDPALSNVEQFESQGRSHVAPGSAVNYAQSPPLSGPHYASTVRAGFYEEPQSAGALVHTLEHGAVVVYYQPDALPEEAEQHLRSLATQYTGTWASVVVVPYPEETEADATFTVTAWRTRLTLDSYDRGAVEAFLAEYLGRGPENSIR